MEGLELNWRAIPEAANAEEWLLASYNGKANTPPIITKTRTKVEAKKRPGYFGVLSKLSKRQSKNETGIKLPFFLLVIVDATY